VKAKSKSSWQKKKMGKVDEICPENKGNSKWAKGENGLFSRRLKI